jgi:hypothetical protein
VEPFNFLDEMVARFRERWETNPHYRATMSGVFGLAVIMGLCSCMIVASLVANSVFASVGFGGGGGGAMAQQPNGGGGADAQPTFPTSIVPTWTVQDTPLPGVAPTSGSTAPTPTPVPTATDIATSTPCSSNCGGGGGGGGAGSISGYGTPNPWVACGNSCDTVVIHTSVPNNGINIIITYCNGATILNNGATTTDGNGNATWSFNGPGGSGNASVHLQAASGASTAFNWPCV